MLLLLAMSAVAQDEEGGLNLTKASDIDLSSESGEEITYSGGLSQTDSYYKKGGAVSVSHSGGNLEIRCMDTDKLSARLQYVVYGTSEPAMEAVGKGMGLKAGGGQVASRVPGRSSGVNKVEATMTVNIPLGVSSISVSHSGDGWARVLDCGGTLKLTSGKSGLYASGDYSGVTATASGGDLKLVMAADALLKSTTALAAPGGNATLLISPAQGGKLNAKGEEVSVSQVVMGTNTPTLVQGDLGVSGPSISISAKSRVEVANNN